MLLGYPINNFFEYKPVYHAAIDPFVLEGRYYELNISDCVTDDYPPVYHWYGENDYVFPLLCYPAQRPALSRALEKHHVPCKEVLFPNATHGVVPAQAPMRRLDAGRCELLGDPDQTAESEQKRSGMR